MTREAAVEAIHGAICNESLEDHLDPDWPGRCVKALDAAVPYMRSLWAAENCDGSSRCASPEHVEGCFSTNPDYTK